MTRSYDERVITEEEILGYLSELNTDQSTAVLNLIEELQHRVGELEEEISNMNAIEKERTARSGWDLYIKR